MVKSMKILGSKILRLSMIYLRKKKPTKDKAESVIKLSADFYILNTYKTSVTIITVM